MDFLDILDFESTHKKSSRVRSWYLYEQYKSLETNLDAAQRQKDKTQQKEILNKELSERRARRRLCSGYSLGDSDLGVDSSNDVMDLPHYDTPCRKCSHYGEENSTSASWQSASLENEQQINEMHPEPFPDYGSIEVISETLYDSQLDLSKDHCSKEPTGDDFYDTPLKLSKDVIAINDVLVDGDFKEQLQQVCQKTDEIELQLENAKENILCLENLTKFCEEDVLSEDYSSDATERNDGLSNYYSVGPTSCSSDNGLFLLWSRLVSFAYQIIRVSHGNCYNDYSSQLLTAILTCDILRRGISKMCDILQPYVCPIKYADDSFANVTKKVKMRKKKERNMHKTPGCRVTKADYTHKNISEPKCTKHGIRKPYSDCTKYNEVLHKCNHSRWSEPCKQSFKISQVSSEESSDRLREFSCKRTEPRHRCGCDKKMKNPMLKLSQYIDNLVKDVENDNKK